jgi:hypothetical protein
MRTAGRIRLPIARKVYVSIPIKNGIIKSIKDVLYVPGLKKKNLLSVEQLANQGHTLMFNICTCYVLIKDK